MSTDLRQVMSQVVAQLCFQVGFDRITESALDLLVDVGEQYIRNLAHTVAKVSNLCGESAQLEDGLLALRLLRQSPQNLLKFAEDVGPYFSAVPVTCTIPLAGKICLNVPPEDHQELKSRPDYIPEYLPLNFVAPEPIDSPFTHQAKPVESPVSKADQSQPEPIVSGVTSTTTSTSATTVAAATTTTRVLPVWAQQSSYRIARVSIDPVTKTLVEHAPPEKIQDLSPDISSTRGYGFNSGTSLFDDTSRSNSRLDESHNPVPSASYRQGATDEQWAAALQATPVARPAKRIVYTPSRFDPSCVPSYASSVRRSSSTALFSAANRRFAVSQTLDVTKKRPAHVIRAPSAKVPKLSTSNRRRRGAFGRARRWARRRNLNKNDATKNSPQLSAPSGVTARSNDPVRSPSPEKTPELKADPRSPSPVSPGYDYGQADSGSDRTPPATSPLAALRLHKSEHTESTETQEAFGEVSESADTGAKFEHVLDEPPADVGSPTTTPVPTIETNSTETSNAKSPPKAAPPRTPPSPSTQPESVEQLNAAPVSFPNLVCNRLRGKKKGRSRTRPTARPSIISSLFQNPLRKKAPAKTPSTTKPGNKKSDTSQKPVVTAGASEKPPPPPVVKLESESKQQQSSAVASKDIGIKSSRLRAKRTLSPAEQTAPRRRTDDAYGSSRRGGLDSSHSSPASDSTEPMVDEARASLLLIPQSPPEKRMFENYSTPKQLVTPTKDSSIETDIKKPGLSSVPFPGKNFEKLRNPAPITVRALASSPSSLESSPTSSISSTSSSLLEEPVDMKVEPRDITGTDLAEPVAVVPPDPMDRNERKPDHACADTRFTSVIRSKDTHLLHDEVTPSMSSSSSVNSSTVSSITSVTVSSALNPPGPPPLLPLTRQSYDASSLKGSTLTTSRNTGMRNSSASIPPPSLVPVTELPTPPVNPEPVPVTGGQHTSAASVPSGTPGGLRIKIRFGASEVRESVASSLSPSSSSSSLSSGSTPSSPYVPERMPAPVCGPSGSSPVHQTATPKEHTSSTLDPKTKNASPASEPPTATKTPKLVIRLGANSQTNTQNRNQPPKLWSTEQSTVDHTVPNIDSRGSGNATTTTTSLPPPPLQLTITRDRLSYRGRTTSEASDSNASTSSGTESLLSSGEDDESVRVPPTHNMLPPPPSLERLPDRPGSMAVAPASAATTFNTRNHISSSRSNHSDSVVSTAAHSQLPPLLPLFSSVPAEKDSSTRMVSTPPHLPSPDGFLTGDASDLTSSQNDARSTRKRQRSVRKHVGSSSKRRFVSADPPPSIAKGATPDRTSFAGSSQSRVRVDSVFTDNESDENAASPMPDLISVNPATRVGPGAATQPVRDTDDLSTALPRNTADVKQPKTQPRTKHTAIFPKSTYSPAIKAAASNALQSTVTPSKDRVGRKHLPSSSSSTGSGGTKSRAPVSSHRPSSSQVVVASAGSSYYFNSSGEQIWLCPVCLLEDDGNLMIGCDSCDDWYHSTCLGLSAEPEDPHWFCPRCAGQPLPVNTGPTSTVSAPVQLPPLLPITSIPSGANQKTKKKKPAEPGHRSTPNSSSKHYKRGVKR